MDLSTSPYSPKIVDFPGSKLCRICSSIPSSFWSDGSRNICVKLQPLESMRLEAERGCQLCAILLMGPDRDPDFQSGNLKTLELKRNAFYAMPEDMDVDRSPLLTLREDTLRGQEHGYRMKNPRHFGFSLVPSPWSALQPVKMGEHVDNIQLIQVWLENCRDNHTQCSSNMKCFLPTRILDLQAFSDSEDIRLVTSIADDLFFDGTPPKYATLSHCWGPPSKQPLTTTQATLSERMTRIPFEKLPQTFQDAVKICRSLRQRFLWIDSLCIVQDDEGDWAKEAALMASVYSYSYFTLAALDSKDSSGGCKMVADIQSSYSNRFVDIDFNGLEEDENKFPRQRLRVFEVPCFDDGSIEVGHLNSRAWTLQERELSRRVISFASQGLLWECNELRATSQRPWENIERSTTRSIYRVPLGDTKGLYKSKATWDDIVEDYSARLLTKQTDRLIALSGIAQAAQEFYEGATYVGGIWSTLIPEGLLWKTVPQRSKATKLANQTDTESAYIAPSWSWASVTSLVDFSLVRASVKVPVDLNLAFGRTIAQRLTVEEMVGVPKYQDPYGALEYGALVLSGALLFNVDISDLVRGPHADLFVGLIKDGVRVGEVSLDAADMASSLSKGKLYFLGLVFSFHVYGLLLREGVNPEDGYTRVGVGMIRYRRSLAIFPKCKPRTIKLV
ncbi:HET domain-containing protein [Neurospora intermedia]|uniref:HET domain-containing protein n=1 Tax=Neurospora intermedia TaxID=5142 RepID=A0ABR3CXT0_NEUIN